MSLRTLAARAIIVTLTVLFLPACSGEEFVGIYAAACDSFATIDFKPGGVADVNRNFCEGYEVEVWNYVLEDDTLELAPEGKLGDTSFVQVKFRISGPAELTPISESSFITCNNCTGSELWVKQ